MQHKTFQMNITINNFTCFPMKNKQHFTRTTRKTFKIRKLSSHYLSLTLSLSYSISLFVCRKEPQNKCWYSDRKIWYVGIIIVFHYKLLKWFMLIKMKIFLMWVVVWNKTRKKVTYINISMLFNIFHSLSAVSWNTNHRFLITTNEIGLCSVINVEAFINLNFMQHTLKCLK